MTYKVFNMNFLELSKRILVFEEICKELKKEGVIFVDNEEPAWEYYDDERRKLGTYIKPREFDLVEFLQTSRQNIYDSHIDCLSKEQVNTIRKILKKHSIKFIEYKSELPDKKHTIDLKKKMI